MWFPLIYTTMGNLGCKKTTGKLILSLVFSQAPQVANTAVPAGGCEALSIIYCSLNKACMGFVYAQVTS